MGAFMGAVPSKRSYFAPYMGTPNHTKVYTADLDSSCQEFFSGGPTVTALLFYRELICRLRVQGEQPRFIQESRDTHAQLR